MYVYISDVFIFIFRWGQWCRSDTTTCGRSNGEDIFVSDMKCYVHSYICNY